MDFSSPYAGPGFKTIFYHCTEKLHAALWKLLTQRLESWVANHSAVISSAWNRIIESSDELPMAMAYRHGLAFLAFSGLGLLDRLVSVHWCNRSVLKRNCWFVIAHQGFVHYIYFLLLCHVTSSKYGVLKLRWRNEMRVYWIENIGKTK